MKQNTKNLIVYLVLAIMLLSSISIFTTKGNTGTYLNLTAEDNSLTITKTKENVLTYIKDYSDLDLSENWDESNVYEIILNGDEILTDTNLEVKDSIVYIKDGGDYLISGTLNDGQIIVYSEDKQSVHLILNGVNISSSSDAPITILNAEETIITLAEGSTNYLTGTGEYVNSSTDADSTTAAIYSKDDLYINGKGSLVINSENKNGIQSKDQLIILNGDFTINSAKEAIKAKDYIVIEDGNFDLTAGEDGIRVTEDEDEEKGFIIIENGNFNIESVRDGIQAETYLIIEDGDFDVTTTSLQISNSNQNPGFGQETQTNSVSAKGLKAETYLEINNAKINIDSTDDALHSDDAIIINSGEISVSTGDDGIHADELVEINNGKIDIMESYEGIEGKNIYINNGNISITSDDDGINVADGSGETMRAISGAGLYVSRGDIYINANGDGLDSNGDMHITGGKIIVDGPTNSGNGAIDCNGEFFMNSGYLIAVGSSGMAETPGQNSEQNSLSIIFSNTLEAGTTISIESETGEEIFSHTSAKMFQSFVASSEELVIGETYDIYVDGELYQDVAISNTITQIGMSAGQNTMGGGAGQNTMDGGAGQMGNKNMGRSH